MGKDPAVLWYWNDWIGGTMAMSRAVKGAYMDLLAAQHNLGHLSLDEIKTVLGSDFGSMWPAIQKKFEKDDNGLYFNARAKFESEKRSAYNSSRKRNRYSKNEKTYVEHMENENENRNGIKNEKEKGGLGEKANRIIEYLRVLTNKPFDESTLSYQNYIKQISNRLKEGFSESDCQEVIEIKVAEWKGTEMEKHLTPDTLFNRTKFAKYRDQVADAKRKGLTLSQIRSSKRFQNDGLMDGVAALYR